MWELQFGENLKYHPGEETLTENYRNRMESTMWQRVLSDLSARQLLAGSWLVFGWL